MSLIARFRALSARLLPSKSSEPMVLLKAGRYRLKNSEVLYVYGEFLKKRSDLESLEPIDEKVEARLIVAAAGAAVRRAMGSDS